MLTRILTACAFAFCCSTTFGATYYIDYLTGSDSNSGINKQRPWKVAPAMVGSAAAYVHQPGDRFIFKGGVTWPAACFTMTIWAGGSGISNRDYYGVDPTWYTGSAWTRPVFDFQGQAVNALYITVSYVQIDNIEMKNMLATSSFGWCYVYFSPTATLNLVSNCWFHDWTNVNGPTQDVGFTCVLGDGPNNEVSQCEFDQSNVAEKSAVCCKNVAYVNFCHFHHTANAVLGYGIIHDNHFHDMSVTDPASHGNAIEVFGGAEIYNNLIHDNASEIAPILTGDTAGASLSYIVYNNVLYNTGIQRAIANDNRASHTVYWRVFNNTLGPGSNGITCDGDTDFFYCENNHLIDSTITLGGPSPEPISLVVSDHNLLQTSAQAAATGYTTSNLFQPTGGNSPTVNQGISLSSFFTTDILGTTRSGIWDIGAYEYRGSSRAGRK